MLSSCFNVPLAIVALSKTWNNMYQDATKFVLLNFSTQYKKSPYVNNHIIHQLTLVTAYFLLSDVHDIDTMGTQTC